MIRTSVDDFAHDLGYYIPKCFFTEPSMLDGVHGRGQ